MPTPHNSAVKGDFAKTVLMPGDPLRSKYIAENFLAEAKLVNNVRGVQGFTGLWKGAKVSVQASGMGIPSIGIYSWELFKEYGVENIIRIGSAGDIAVESSVQSAVGERGLSIRAGNVLSADNFYNDGSDGPDQWRKLGVLAVEMEAAGLYMTAARTGGHALCLCTISDHLYRPEELTPEERQTGFNDMITLALDTAAALAN